MFSIISLFIFVIIIIVGAIIWVFGYKDFKKRKGTLQEFIIFCIIASVILTVLGNVGNLFQDNNSEFDKYGHNSPMAQLVSPKPGENVSGIINIIVNFTDEGGNIESCEVWISDKLYGDPVYDIHWKEKKEPCELISILKVFDTTILPNGNYFINIEGTDSTGISCNGGYRITIYN
jgi:hypothetical protein